jgi:hypothetical protein
LHRNVGGALHACIERNKIIVTFELKAVAAQIDEGNIIGSQARGPVEEVAKCSSDRVLVEVTSPHDFKPCRFKSLGDQTCIIRSSFNCTGCIGRIAYN